MKRRTRRALHRHQAWLANNQSLVLRAAGAGLAVLVLIQLFYPGSRLPLFASVDGINLSAWDKADAAKRLDAVSAAAPLEVRLGNSKQSYDTPKPADVGIRISNQDRLYRATYPWYIRLIPTSLFWFGLLQSEQPPRYSADREVASAYLTKKVGPNCRITPRDATLRQAGSTLTVVPSEAGGTCDQTQAVNALTSARPQANATTVVKIALDVAAPNVGDDEASRLATELNAATKNGVAIKAGDKTFTATQKDVLSWLRFTSDGSNLTFEIIPDKAAATLARSVTPLVAKPAGVTRVSTLDFDETTRSDGQPGQTLDVGATVADIAGVLAGKKSIATAAVTPLAPSVQYSRSYTKTSTGIAAQIKFYDDDNKGIFGVSFSELGGQGLAAQHNGSQQFVTASTYKLFVAFSTLKRVDAGKLKWSDADISSGRDLAKCFDDMIVKSDNACAEALIKKIGANELNSDIKSIGLTNTAFRADNNMTTANDLASYLTQLETAKLPIKPESRDRLLGAMKRNVYRQGVPSGASGQTADKVGFLWGLLHDAAIVYSPKGTYVLAVMSDGSSWASIADLTRKIEALR